MGTVVGESISPELWLESLGNNHSLWVTPYIHSVLLKFPSCFTGLDLLLKFFLLRRHDSTLWWPQRMSISISDLRFLCSFRHKKLKMAISDCEFIRGRVWQGLRNVLFRLASRLGCFSSPELGQHWIARASCSFFHQTWRDRWKRWQLHLGRTWCLLKGLHCQLSLLSVLSITLPLRYCTLMLQVRARTNVYLEDVWESSQSASQWWAPRACDLNISCQVSQKCTNDIFRGQIQCQASPLRCR